MCISERERVSAFLAVSYNRRAIWLTYALWSPNHSWRHTTHPFDFLTSAGLLVGVCLCRLIYSGGWAGVIKNVISACLVCSCFLIMMQTWSHPDLLPRSFISEWNDWNAFPNLRHCEHAICLRSTYRAIGAEMREVHGIRIIQVLPVMWSLVPTKPS